MADKVIHLGKSRKYRRRKNKKGAFLLLILILFGLGFALVSIMSLLKIQTIDIIGNQYYSNQQIFEIVGIDGQTSILKSRLNQHIDVSEYPYLEAIEINYGDFSSIQIHVIEKSIVGYLAYGDTGYISVDREGYAIDFTENLPDYNVFIEGIVISEFVLGEKVDLDNDIIQAFIMFKQAREQYELDISFIHFVDGKTNNIMFMIDDLTVEFGSMERFNEKMQKITDVLEVIFGQNKRIYDVEHNTLK